MSLSTTAIAELDAFALGHAFRRKALSPVEAAKDALDRAEAAQPVVNAFALIDRERTLADARASEARWMRGEPLGAFDGVSVTIKDNLSVEGWPSRKGSTVTPDAAMDYDAPVTARCKEAGLVVLGTTTMPEFGWIGLSTSPLTGHTRNPWNRERTAGGSSSGAAACAALGIGRFHLGTDGLGSIRIPAAYCGVPGIKPTYGRVPAYPISVMGELAHLGPIAGTVREVAALLTILSGPDIRDPMAWNTPAPDFTVGIDEGVRRLRVAYSPRLGFVEKIDPAVEKAVAAAAATFQSMGAVVEEVDPPIDDPSPIAWDIWNAGAALALKSFGPVERAQMDPGLVACAEAGATTLASDLIDALLYRRTRAVIAMAKFHETYDLLLTPTMPTGAIPLGADLPPPGFAGVAEWGPLWTDWCRFTPPFNVTQQPAGTVPCGLDADGLPVGLQIVGWRRQEALVLRAMRAFESARPPARVPMSHGRP
jgi:aspartyl-tRNA(Asn)/glutamyl-tRNA(Gln) amidotransferase subunit A